MRLDGKVALITGVSSGFGRSCGRIFAEAGAKVVGVARRSDRGRALEDEVRSSGGEFTFVAADVTRTEACREAVAAAVATYGRLDILVNNAGAAGSHPVEASHLVSEADWDEVVDTNLKGAFFCCRHAIGAMRTTGGGVIWNIASINAVQAIARMAAYNASKAALLQLTRTLAVEYGEDNIRVNAIVLGGGGTEMATFVADEMARTMRGPDYERSRPAPRMDLDDFARLLVLLACDEARLLTGAVVAVDRGISAGLLTSRMIWAKAADLTDL
jgi:NAD(P)-dependent dehydrogenase (short-subunit alcohol dehydrogenase family)